MSREAKIAELNRLRKVEELNRLRAESANPPAQDPGGDALKAGVHGAAQGFTLGWADELQAGLGAAWDVGEAALGQRGDIDFGDAYDTRLKPQRKELAKAQEDSPWAYGAGNVAGAAALSLTPVGRVLNPIAGATTAARIGTAAAGGALSGAGTSTANPTDSPAAALEFLQDTGKGAALGAFVQGGVDAAGKAVGKVAEAVPAKLKDMAERRAFKAAVGNQQKVYDDAAGRGAINRIGRDLLDDQVVTFGSKAGDIAKRADSAKKDIGQQIGMVLDDLDQEVPDAISGANIAAKMRAYADEIDTPQTRAVAANVRKQAEEFEAMGHMSLRKAQDLKNSYRYNPGDPSTMTLGKDATNKLKGIVGDELEEGVAVASSVVKPQAQPMSQSVAVGGGTSGGSGLQPVTKQATSAQSEAYEGLKAKYGSHATAAKAAKTLANRQEKNRTVSLTDTIFGAAAGGATLNPVVGAGVAFGNKLLRERGSSAAAVTADKLAKKLAAPGAQKFAKVLEAAAARGESAVAITHTILMQREPQYRALFEDDQSSQVR